MSGENKNIKTSLSDFLNYLKGLFSGRERNALEKHMQKDPFAEEAMEGFENLSTDEIKEDLLKLNARLHRRMEKNNRVLFFRIAATIAVILTVSTLYFTLSDRKLEDFEGNKEITEVIPDSENLKEEPVEISNLQEERFEKEDSEPEEMKIADKKETDTEPLEEVDQEEEGGNKIINEVDAAQPVLAQPTKTEIQKEEKLTEPAMVTEEVQEEAISVPEQDVFAPPATRAKSATRRQVLVSADEKISSEILSGKVISAEDSMPIPGASVVIKGTDMGTVTNKEGQFTFSSIQVNNPILEASFIGMENQEINVRRGENIEITLQPSEMALSEVVVVGYEPENENVGAVSEIRDLDNEVVNSYKGAYPEQGFREFRNYIEKNIIVPDTSVEKVVVVLKFVINKNGRPEEIKAVRSPGEKYTLEGIRLLKDGPDWIPAENEGTYIPIENRIRIVFRK